MKTFGMLKISMILAGIGAALLLSPACKGQEVSPDHFTDTGVLDVYEGIPGRAVTHEVAQNPPALQASTRQAKARTILQPTGKRRSLSSEHLAAQAVAEEPKTVPSTPRKP